MCIFHVDHWLGPCTARGGGRPRGCSYPPGFIGLRIVHFTLVLPVRFLVQLVGDLVCQGGGGGFEIDENWILCCQCVGGSLLI